MNLREILVYLKTISEPNPCDFEPFYIDILLISELCTLLMLILANVPEGIAFNPNKLITSVY